MSACRIAKLAMVVILFGSVSSGLATAQLPCLRVDEGASMELCEECPGYQFCFCLYASHACNNYRILCNGRWPVLEEGLLTVITHYEPCYWMKPCKSQYGGLCNPLTNPCVTYGTELPVESFPVYEQDIVACHVK